MTSKERIALIQFTKEVISKEQKYLEQDIKNEKQLIELMNMSSNGNLALQKYLRLIVPNQALIKARNEEIEKREKQVSLLENVDVEKMTLDEFEKYINS